VHLQPLHMLERRDNDILLFSLKMTASRMATRIERLAPFKAMAPADKPAEAHLNCSVRSSPWRAVSTHSSGLLDAQLPAVYGAHHAACCTAWKAVMAIFCCCFFSLEENDCLCGWLRGSNTDLAPSRR
jgi:hypothetical protein